MSTPIRISGTLAPLADTDNYPVTDESFHRGGYQTVATVEARDTIPPSRLKIGSHLRTESDGKFWRLTQESPPLWIEVDLEAVLAQAAADAAQSTATAAQSAAQTAANDAQAAVDTSLEAITKADAAVAASAGFPVADFLGTLTTLAQDPGLASTLSGKWWQMGVAGTLTHANAGGLVVAIGDRLLSNGTVWLKYLTPPTYLPANSVPLPTLTPAVRRRYGEDAAIPDYQWTIQAPSGALGLGIKNDGTLIGKFGIDVAISNGITFGRQVDGSFDLSFGTIEGVVPLGASKLDYRNDGAWGGYVYAITDPQNRVAFGIHTDGSLTGQLAVPEVVTARGTKSSLDARLDVSIDDNGHLRSSDWNRSKLREVRQRLMAINQAATKTLTLACIGDSWTHGGFRYVKPLMLWLQREFGFYGQGWCGFGKYSTSGANDSAAATLTALRTGQFESTQLTYYANQPSPDLCGVFSSTIGDKVTVTLSADPVQAVNLHYLKQAGGGSIQYRWNAGAWTTISTAGSGVGIDALAAVPAGTWSLELEVLSPGSGVILFGIEAKKTSGSGVMVHKLGATGSRASQWAAIDASLWQAGLASLAPNLVTILLGTNEQSGYTPTVFAGHLQTMIDRIRIAAPPADILLVITPENQAGRATPMSSYALAMRDLAISANTAFLDLQTFFGEQPASYADGSSRPWFAVDGLHPNQDGGYAIAAAIAEQLGVPLT